MGCQVTGTLHWGKECGKGLGHGANGHWGQPSSNITDAFHIFSVEWSAEKIAWSVDGQEYFQQNSSTKVDGVNVQIPHGPFHFIINTARRPVPWQDFPWPVQMEVDWVKAWEPMQQSAAALNPDEATRARSASSALPVLKTDDLHSPRPGANQMRAADATVTRGLGRDTAGQ